jgi:hypothetical protein
MGYSKKSGVKMSGSPLAKYGCGGKKAAFKMEGIIPTKQERIENITLKLKEGSKPEGEFRTTESTRKNEKSLNKKKKLEERRQKLQKKLQNI